jgi:hypothetical protein
VGGTVAKGVNLFVAMQRLADERGFGLSPVRHHLTNIRKTLESFDFFHDWHVDAIALHSDEDADCPDTLVLKLRLVNRRVIVTFHGMTRLGIDGGGTVNIVLSLEPVQPDTETERLAAKLFKNSLKGSRVADNTVILYPTAGFAIAVEFDTLIVELDGLVQRE